MIVPNLLLVPPRMPWSSVGIHVHVVGSINPFRKAATLEQAASDVLGTWYETSRRRPQYRCCGLADGGGRCEREVASAPKL